MTHLIHLSKIQSLKVLQSQKWWQNKSVGESIKQLSFLHRKIVVCSYSMSEIFGKNKWILFNCFIFLFFVFFFFKLYFWMNDHLFLMSASLRPSLGVSTVRAIALKPALSALLTSCATTFLSLYTWRISRASNQWF